VKNLQEVISRADADTKSIAQSRWPESTSGMELSEQIDVLKQLVVRRLFEECGSLRTGGAAESANQKDQAQTYSFENDHGIALLRSRRSGDSAEADGTASAGSCACAGSCAHKK
jgi:hypothetical protein